MRLIDRAVACGLVLLTCACERQSLDRADALGVVEQPPFASAERTAFLAVVISGDVSGVTFVMMPAVHDLEFGWKRHYTVSAFAPHLSPTMTQSGSVAVESEDTVSVRIGPAKLDFRPIGCSWGGVLHESQVAVSGAEYIL